MYTKEVMARFKDPKHLGEVEEADAIGEVGNVICGDIMKISIKVENNIIIDAKVQTFGCVAAISTSDIVCELAIGKSLDEALKITKEDVIDRLKELPGEKVHCSLLGLDALKKAIEEYKSKNK